VNGAESDACDLPASGPEPAAGAEEVLDQTVESDWVVTTVVDGNDPDEADLPAWPPAAPSPAAAVPAVVDHLAEHLAALDGRVAPLEGLAGAVAALRQATGQEFDRSAGVLNGHDRALTQLHESLAVVSGRLQSLEAREATAPVASPPPPAPTELYEQALGNVLEQLEAFDHRLRSVDLGEVSARVAGIEGRLATLDQLLPVVQALRVTVRADEELLAAEIATRERTGDDGGPARAEDLAAVAARLAEVEGRVAPLETAPDDIAALSRILRRGLDAVTADVQAREQVLRRALQKEIERLHATSDDREGVVGETAQRLEQVERQLRGTAQAHDDAVAATARRLDALESRLVSVDTLAEDLDNLRAGARRELERLRAASQTHDQSMAETGRRFAALDGRLTRLDTLPGEVQSLRSAMRQEGERAVVTVRSVEERAAEQSDKAFRQLRQLADSITEAHQRGAGIAAEVESMQSALRGMRRALAETTQRLDARAADVDRGSEPDPAPEPAPPIPDGPGPVQ